MMRWDLVTSAQVGDSTNEAFIRSLGVNNFDLVRGGPLATIFRALWRRQQLLKECGARFVLSRATRDVHVKFLLQQWRGEVVYPEQRRRIGQGGPVYLRPCI